jgi:hypothetical protein
MAKPSTIRSTIKNDPFATVIPLNGDEPAAEAASAVPNEPAATPPRSFKRDKLTVHLRPDLIARVKNAAYWNPRLTITGIAEMGIYEAIERIEKEYGGPYPPREEELRGGRPMK